MSISLQESPDDGAGITAIVAIQRLQNNNSLGQGRRMDQVLFRRAFSGVIRILSAKYGRLYKLNIVNEVQLGS